MREEEKILRAPNIANIEQYIDRVDEMIERKRIVFAEKAKKAGLSIGGRRKAQTMVISDKQTLRRCVKQAVRRAAVVETLLNFDAARGEMGIKALTTSIPKAEGLTPLQADAAAAFAAMDALEMPIEDMSRARR